MDESEACGDGDRARMIHSAEDAELYTEYAVVVSLRKKLARWHRCRTSQPAAHRWTSSQIPRRSSRTQPFWRQRRPSRKEKKQASLVAQWDLQLVDPAAIDLHRPEIIRFSILNSHIAEPAMKHPRPRRLFPRLHPPHWTDPRPHRQPSNWTLRHATTSCQPTHQARSRSRLPANQQQPSRQPGPGWPNNCEVLPTTRYYD